MNERIKKITTVVKDKWTGFSKAVKIMLIAIPVAIIAIIIILAIISNNRGKSVLFSGLTTAEQGEIAAAITELGITDVNVSANGEITVPSDQVDYLRMQLAVQGFPKNATNYSIWNDGVDLWSTDSDKREVQRQQRETRIAATLTQLSSVRSATVNLDVPPTREYVITEAKEVPSCSVQLKLVDGYELTNAEVRAIYNLVATSVTNLTNENISITDTLGREYDWISAEEEAAGLQDASGTIIGQKRLKFQKDVQAALMANLESMLTKMYGKNHYAVNVSALLNFDDKEIVDTEYHPVDENNTGVLDHWVHVGEGVDLENTDGLVGVTPNGDRSPDYPTLDGLEDGETYFYVKDEYQYDVSNTITKIKKDGYSIDRLSVGVAIDSTDITEGERQMIQEFIANAVGADPVYVSVYNTSFYIQPGGSTVDSNNPNGQLNIWTNPPDAYRNILLFVVIALGIILIILLIASLGMSRSRKKKIRRRQEQALAAAQAAAASDIYGGSERDMPQEIDFNIASLTEEAGKESRETILKREIADFAKTSPDIVASIIKNMLREES